MELYNNIADTLSKKGINAVVGTIYDLQQVWLSWYRGSVDDFHFYNENVNGQTVQKERLTMNMAKKNCEDIAKLLWTEKTRIELDSDKATEKLWQVLDSKKNSFTINFPNFIEKTLAIGTGVLIEYKDVNNETIIDYLDGTVVLPYKYTNSCINGLITVSRFTENKGKAKVFYTHLTYHEYDGKVYRRLNELYKSKVESELGKEVDFNEKFPNVIESLEVETEVPRFQVLKPNITNNFDISSPIGISVIANSIDRYKAIDTKYDSFMNEFNLGKKRIIVDSTTLKSQFQADSDGNVRQVQYFDKNDSVFVAINGIEEKAKEIDFTLRAQEHIDSINSELSWLGDNIGLGKEAYSFSKSGLKTATEVISENSEAFRTKVHYDIIVNDVIYDLVKVICEMEGIKTKSITIVSDDSIIEDKNTEKARAMQEVSLGLRSKKSYLTDVEGMSEEEATKELEQIQKEKISNEEAFGFNVEEE